MARNVLTRVRPGSASWWLYLALMGYLGLGLPVYLVLNPVDGWELAASMAISILALGVAFVLALRHPVLAVRATDDQGDLRPWVTGVIAGLLLLGFIAITVTGFTAPADAPRLPMIALGVVVVVLMVYLVLVILVGGHRTHGTRFGIRRPDATVVRLEPESSSSPSEDDPVFRRD